MRWLVMIAVTDIPAWGHDCFVVVVVVVVVVIIIIIIITTGDTGKNKLELFYTI